jgi:uncharacterized iron-regulated protein
MRILPLVLLLAGCAASTPSPMSPHDKANNPHGPHDLRQMALPFHVLAARGGTQVDEKTFFAALTEADAICIGESHDNPHHHWVQLMLLEHLAQTKRPLAIGFEMFQKPFQGVLDDYAAGKIDEPALLTRTAWAERWGYDFWMYRPMVELGRQGLSLLALNAPKEITRKVSREGLDALGPAEKASLPELVLDDGDHRAWFKDATASHGGPAENFERFYTAQVIWDETMAETGAKWLAGGPDRQLVVLAGIGHCMEAGIPRRLKRRGVEKVLSLQAVVDREGAVGEALAAPENDYIVVLDGRANPHTPHPK